MLQELKDIWRIEQYVANALNFGGITEVALEIHKNKNKILIYL